ncbi:DUF3566 domain-containing protein [Cellulomonas pakistanensis]|uniref:DUF3566 domain-containing protein n=1 Tax=Cellulomonas pakistanensis TaxID=992287 RepID=A0A919P803_9CELL|nr:DUF3566 domain-containing protein [Cellulomonas pakistanensis]GIG34803.1 hypothetical protein Cpa01nite_01840 [Cellulomonas pakistanensis]
MTDTPPSIPPRKGDAGDKPTGRTATEQADRGSSATVSSGKGPATKATPAAKGGTPRTSTKTGPAATTTTQEPVRPAAGGSAKPAGAASGGSSTAGASGSAAASGAAAGAATATAARPATSGSLTGSGPRRVRLAVSRVDPWSVMKLSFLMSVAIGIMIVVATAVVWVTLDSLHVFATINDLVEEILADSDINLMQYVEFDRVLSIATLVAVVDIFLITALATIGAFLYNITAALVGGVHVTMTDE